MKINLLEYIPSKVVSDNKSIHTFHISKEGEIIPGRKDIVVPKGKIGLWYITQTPSKGKVYFHFLIPCSIKLDKNLLKSMGLYMADGSRTFSSQIIFQNNEPEAINIFMQCFRKNFEIGFEDWHWCINFNERLKAKESVTETQEREGASVNFWLKSTPIVLDSAFPTFIRYSNKNYEGKSLRSKAWGSLTISCGNVILKNFWLSLCRNLVEEVIKKEDKKLASAILCGWIAGDGYCRFKIYKNGPMRQIGVISTGLEKELLVKLFNLLKIKAKESNNNIYFYGLLNFLISYKNGLLELNPYKQLNLLKALKASKILSSPEVKEELESHKMAIKNEINRIEIEIKQREFLFNKFKQTPLPLKIEKFQPSSWSDFVKGLMVTLNTTPSKLAGTINSGITTLEKWINQKVNPSPKYQLKLLSLAKKSEWEEVESLGHATSNIEWNHFITGILIENKLTRKGLAKILSIHVNTLESIINGRTNPSFTTISKIFELVGWKSIRELTKLSKYVTKVNWMELVTEILNKKNLTQQQLAKVLSCSRSLVREWKAGNAKPTTRHQKKLLELA